MSTELMRWEPMRELAALRDEIERAFRQPFGAHSTEAVLAGAWTPALDVEETDAAFEVHVEAPGVETEDIDVTVEDGVLTISGERRFYEDKDESQFRRVERRFGRFHRTLRLPTPVDPEKVEASYTGGMLSVNIPKTEAAKPHKIDITVA